MARATPLGTKRMCLFSFLIVELMIKKLYIILSPVTGSSEPCHLSLWSVDTTSYGIAVHIESRLGKNGTIGRKYDDDIIILNINNNYGIEFARNNPFNLNTVEIFLKNRKKFTLLYLSLFECTLLSRSL